MSVMQWWLRESACCCSAARSACSADTSCRSSAHARRASSNSRTKTSASDELRPRRRRASSSLACVVLRTCSHARARMGRKSRRRAEQREHAESHVGRPDSADRVYVLPFHSHACMHKAMQVPAFPRPLTCVPPASYPPLHMSAAASHFWAWQSPLAEPLPTQRPAPC
eukprot:366548-Chlamydomonas_euryale.AAC.11